LECTGTPGTRAALEVDERSGLVYRGVPGTKLSASAGHERLAVWIPAASLNQRWPRCWTAPSRRISPSSPSSTGVRRRRRVLRRLLGLVVEELGSGAPFAGSDVATRSFTDLVLYTLLRAFPHNHSERLARAGSPAVPGIVRRAEAHIRAHVEEPIALHEVADAAGCSVRNLQLGFQRFRGTTPLAAIRQARLEAARDALRSGGPGATVADLAFRFGFTNPGRFAHFYKAAFGELPLEALRRQAPPRRLRTR
jgi:AraC-like DNA-binding protein